jgi:dipeptidyl aminopeptidase/acylaminoacyl peptidase
VKRLGVVVLLLVAALPASAARLPVTAPHDWWPVSSPDSKLIAFTEVNGQGRLFTLEVFAFGTQRARKLAQSSYQLLPSWSPDSTRIAYQSGGRVWTVGVDGAGRRELGAGLYPSWSPDGNTVAFVQAGVIHAGAARLGTGVLGVPAWSPDGGRLGFPQSDGVYVATLAGGVKRVAAPAAEVRDVRFAPDGKLLAFAANGVVYDVPADGSSAPARLAGPFRNVSPLAWSNSSDELAYTTGSALAVTDLNGGVHTQAGAKTSGIGASFAPGDPHSRVRFYSGPNPSCTGHDAIRMFQNGRVTGSCSIAGTAHADVIVGTAGGGDVMGAGAGNDTIHARNGRRDTIDCGAGRDTVWADRIDRLAHCEIVRR